jgi:hypothetical protein
VDAAVELFDRNGYEPTTIAGIAAAAEIGTRTFFNYFASKEELLFPESDARVVTAIEAIAARGAKKTTLRPTCSCARCRPWAPRTTTWPAASPSCACG